MHSSNRLLCNPPTTATWQVSFGHPTIGHRVTAMYPRITALQSNPLHFPIWTFCELSNTPTLSLSISSAMLWAVNLGTLVV